MRTVPNAAMLAARRAASRSVALKKAMKEADDLTYFRRHDLLRANEGGVTYRDLHELTGMSLTIIGEQIAKAKADVAAGLGPTKNGKRPREGR